MLCCLLTPLIRLISRRCRLPLVFLLPVLVVCRRRLCICFGVRCRPSIRLSLLRVILSRRRCRCRRLPVFRNGLIVRLLVVRCRLPWLMVRLCRLRCRRPLLFRRVIVVFGVNPNRNVLLAPLDRLCPLLWRGRVLVRRCRLSAIRCRCTLRWRNRRGLVRR